MRTPKPLLSAVIATAAVVLSACGAPLVASTEGAASPAPSSEGPGSATGPDAEQSEWLEELRANRTELEQQRDRERTEAEDLLPMPEGADWGLVEEFGVLDEQIAMLEAGNGLPEGESRPTTLWYEDGFFRAQMAIDWQCAWLSEAASRYDAGDVGAAQEAVERLRSFGDNPLAVHFPDHDVFMSTYVEPLGPDDTTAATPSLQHCSTESLVPAYRESR